MDSLVICRSGGRVVWRISPIICLRIRVNAGWRGEVGGCEEVISPFTRRSRRREDVERG